MQRSISHARTLQLKTKLCLFSKQSSLLSFYALTSGGKPKVHWHFPSMHSELYICALEVIEPTWVLEMLVMNVGEQLSRAKEGSRTHPRWSKERYFKPASSNQSKPPSFRSISMPSGTLRGGLKLKTSGRTRSGSTIEKHKRKQIVKCLRINILSAFWPNTILKTLWESGKNMD